MQRRSFALGMLLGAAGRTLAAASEMAREPAHPGAGISADEFRRYVEAFNGGDFPGFGAFYAADVDFRGQGGQFRGRAAVLEFYRTVKRRVRETLTIEALVVNERAILADMLTELHVLEDWPDFATGPLHRGETRRSENFIWYDIEQRHFTRVRSAHYGDGTGAVAPAGAQAPEGEPAISETQFRAYIDAFNRDDYAAFSRFYAEDVVLVLAGKRELRGHRAIIDFYRAVKARTRRTIHVDRFLASGNFIAAELHSEFLALEDLPDFIAGPMRRGGRTFINTFVLYELRGGRFARIRSAEFRKINEGTAS